MSLKSNFLELKTRLIAIEKMMRVHCIALEALIMRMMWIIGILLLISIGILILSISIHILHIR